MRRLVAVLAVFVTLGFAAPHAQRQAAAPAAAKAPAPFAAPKDAIKGTRPVYFDIESASPTTVWERDRLPIGARIEGPAIVEQFDATTVVPPTWRGTVDGLGNLILERTEAR